MMTIITINFYHQGGPPQCFVKYVFLVATFLLLPGDGFLRFSDFITTVEEYKKPGDKDDLIMAFRVFDPRNKGYAEAQEIRKVFHGLKDIATEEIEGLLESANLQENRHIYFDGKICSLNYKKMGTIGYCKV